MNPVDHADSDELPPAPDYTPEYVCEECRRTIDKKEATQCRECSRELCRVCRPSHRCGSADDMEW